jgi:hypothetical protein
MMNFKRKQAPAYDAEPFDVSGIEEDIREVIGEVAQSRAVERYAPAVLPPNVIELGQVTAQAVMAQHEAAVKTIEAMREPMRELSADHEKALADLVAEMKYIEETAARFQELGQQRRDLIQKTSEVITEVRKICDDFRAKIEPHPDVP